MITGAITTLWTALISVTAATVGAAAAYLFGRGRDRREATDSARDEALQLAEIRAARILELERRVGELEKKNHELAVELATARARPDLDSVAELLRMHDQRTQQAFDLFKQETSEIATVLQSVHLALGAIARRLEASTTA